MLTFKVPMETLQLVDLEFEMVYHVPTGVFEKVNMRQFDTKQVLGEAQFSTSRRSNEE